MPASKLRPKLLAIHELTFEAISSDESLKALESLWIESKNYLRTNSLQHDDRALLAALVCNHDIIASTMSDAEAFLTNLMKEPLPDLENGVTCECQA
jgi:hypothetical protein